MTGKNQQNKLADDRWKKQAAKLDGGTGVLSRVQPGTEFLSKDAKWNGQMLYNEY
jgi:hypothetical protein